MAYDSERIIQIGELEKRGKTTRFGIKEKDRSRHIYVIGQTGTGKSTLLEMLAMQDLRNGTGLIFLDPHGQSVDGLLKYVTESHLDDVIYFAPHLQEKPIGLNIMEDIGYDKRHLVVSSLMASFEKIWGAATWSDRMAYILSNTLLALIEYPGTTLLDVGRMYSSKDFREKVVANIKDPQVKKYWVEEFANYTERYAQEATPSIQNKLGQFTSNPLMRNIIGQKKSAIDFRKIMDEGKMLLVNLSKGQIGENNARMLGVLFTTKIYLAALSRSDMAKAELEAAQPCNFFVDEFQSFANSSFSDILSEARKYKLNLVLAHQYLGQLYTDDTGGGNAIRDAVFGNVGTFVSFRVGPVDAEIIAKQFAPNIAEEDLVALPRYHVYLTLNIDGAGSTPFSARTFYEPAPEGGSLEDEVIQKTMDTYGVDREIVEEIVRKNIEDDDKAKQEAQKSQGGKGGNRNQGFQQRPGQGKGGWQNRGGGQQDKKEEEKSHMPLKGLLENIKKQKPETQKTPEQPERKQRAEKKEDKPHTSKQQNKEPQKDKTPLFSKIFSKEKDRTQEEQEENKKQPVVTTEETPHVQEEVKAQKPDRKHDQLKPKVSERVSERTPAEIAPTQQKQPEQRVDEQTHGKAVPTQQRRRRERGKPQRRERVDRQQSQGGRSRRHQDQSLQRRGNNEIDKGIQKREGASVQQEQKSEQTQDSQQTDTQQQARTGHRNRRQQSYKQQRTTSGTTNSEERQQRGGQEPRQQRNIPEKTDAGAVQQQELKKEQRSQNTDQERVHDNKQQDMQQQRSRQQSEAVQQQDTPRPQPQPEEKPQHTPIRQGGGLGDLIQNTQSTGLQKDLAVKPKKEKEAPPIRYEEGWVSIGDLSKTKQDA